MLEQGIIKNNEMITNDIWRMHISAPGIAAAAEPGQFVNIRLVKNLDPLLRRPISLHRIDKDNGTIDLLYLIVGRGTKMLSQMEAGEEIDLLGPLGKGFNLEFPGDKALILGGGIGIAPLFPLMHHLVTEKKTIKLLIGAKNKESIVDMNLYKQQGIPFRCATDDGSLGHRGFITDILKEEVEQGDWDYIYACGPMPMLKTVEAIAEENKIRGEVSIEENMGCGLGVCLCCSCKSKEGGYKKVCDDGPVFEMGVIDYE